jgi:spore coat polysaccharide biosynthesis predicted glycosyltransferase SpsG
VIESSLNTLKRNRKILILTHSNKKIGNGNFVRSNSLYNYLEKEKFNVSLFHNKKQKEITNYINKNNIFLIIIDSNLFKISLINFLIKKYTVICLDNHQTITPHYNILIHEHKKINVKIKKFIGLKYINLRKQFINKTKIKKKYSFTKEVLICLGSGDIKNQGLKISKYLLKRGFKVTLIRGNNNSKINTFKNKNFVIKNNVINIHNLFKKFKFVITNGGTTLFENLCYKNSVYVLPQTKQEKTIANIFLKKKQILGFGILNFYRFDLDKYPKFKINRNNIDGMGAERITKIVYKILTDE